MDTWLRNIEQAKAKQKQTETSETTIQPDTQVPGCSHWSSQHISEDSEETPEDSQINSAPIEILGLQSVNEDSESFTSVELPSKKKRKTDDNSKKKTFVSSWQNMNEFKGWLEKVPTSKHKNDYALCKVCNCEILAQKSVLLKHSHSEKHKINWEKVRTTPKISELCKPKKGEIEVKTAQLKLSSFLATNNLPFSLMDTLTPLLKSIFTDSNIVRDMNLKKTKATNIICNSLGENFLQDIYKKLSKPGSFFSIIMDETTDISTRKQCAFTVIFFEGNSTKTQFFDIVEVHNSTAVGLFNLFKEVLVSKNIPLTNLVGFSSDTTNVMVGEHHSVFSMIQEELPHVVCVRCSCHMAHLAISRACLKLPRHVEDFLRNIGSHFSRSSSRRHKFEEFQQFFKVDIHKILSPATTRWLSLKECVERVLEQYEPLRAYLMEIVYEDPSVTTETMLETMNNRFTILYLEFMSYSLGLMTEFNLIFQTEKPLLYRIKPEAENLLKSLCCNFIKITAIRKAENVFTLNHKNPTDFVPLEQIYLGVSATETFEELKKNSNTKDIENFLKSILAFYIDLVSNIKDKFSFRDPIYEMIEILDPKNPQKFQIKSLQHIVNRFPVLINHINIQELDNEWRRHALLNFEDITYTDCEQYWSKIFNLKNEGGVNLFTNLEKVLSLLLVLPFSNASVERVFSDLFNIKNDKRNLLGNTAIRALLATKQGVESQGGVVKFQPTNKMLTANVWHDKKK